MWIMIAGPYTSGGADPELRAQRLQAMNEAAYQVFLKGHIPIIGVNMALPVIQSQSDDVFDAVMMPISLALTKRCDAILRIGGASKGADDEVQRFIDAGKPVFYSIRDVT